MPIIRAAFGDRPVLAEGVFVAENATLIGDVELAKGASVWYGAVLRGDCGKIRVGARTNIQDLACIHMTTGVSHTLIGEDVTVGHSAIIHGAKVGDRSLIGMGAVLLDNVEVGAECVIAAGSVLPPGMVVPDGSLVRGQPARIVREASSEERMMGIRGAEAYAALAKEHMKNER